MRTLALVVCSMMTVGVIAQTPRTPEPLAWASERDAALDARLAALDPADPMSYFELGEDVVSLFPGEGGYRLARELFALSYALDEAQGGRLGLAPSAALALAEITESPEERRWLLTMARTIREGGDRRDDDSGVSRERAQAAEALSLHRGGEYQRLRPLLRRIELRRALRDAGLERADVEKLAALVERDAATDRDEGRVDRRTRDEEDLSPHPRNGGNPGPGLSTDETVLSLRAELLLVGASPTSWASDLVVRSGAPARDLDPAEMLTTAGVRADRSAWSPGSRGWQNGRWVEVLP